MTMFEENQPLEGRLVTALQETGQGWSFDAKVPGGWTGLELGVDEMV